VARNNLPVAPYRVDGFFTVRTPLLPFTEYERWTAALKAPQALSAGDELESALREDKERLREALRELLRRPEIREALFLASPSLDQSVAEWLQNAESERGRGAELAIVRYLQRMVHRCTPFGLFAGLSMARFDAHTRLALEPLQANRRWTRFDRGCMSRLVNSLEQSTALRKCMTLRPNSSLYRTGGRMRYTEFSVDENGSRSYKLIAVEESPHLLATLDRARTGTTLAKLARALTEDGDVEFEEAEEFVLELIDAQILTLDLEPRITGPDPIDELVELLDSCSETSGVARTIRTTCAQMRDLDRYGIGHDPQVYRAMAKSLEALPISVDLSKLWQVDMFKPTGRFALGQEVAQVIEDCTAILRRITPVRPEDSLATFRDAFRRRYGDKWLPLMEVLDPESGIGFAAGATSAAADAALLGGFAIGQGLESTDSGWTPREIFLFRRLQTLLSSGQREWKLSDDDLRALDEGVSSRAIPDSAAIVLMLAADSEDAIERGEYRLVFDGCFGPPGVRMLGRFCYGDAELDERTQAHLRAEESYRPDAIFAELVHLPQGRSANVLVRPVLRSHEIAFLGRSGADANQQIALSDLLVSVIDDRVLLYSRAHGKEVIPRLTSALGFAATLGVSQFFGALAGQHMQNWLGWSWGKIDKEPFLPRVSYGRIVLSRASWTVEAADFKAILQSAGAERFRRTQAWRLARALPRFCQFAENDNELLVDLDNVLSIDTFCDLVKRRPWFRLEECIPAADELPVRGPEGRYAHEIIVPLLRTRDPQEALPRAVTFRPLDDAGIAENLAPGSEWLFLKLYGGEGTADSVLTEAIAPAIAELRARGTIDAWFFLRYSDPDPHLRVRLRGNRARLCGDALPELHDRLKSMLGGRLWRIELGTYQREIDRYGGPSNILHAERLFELDSEAVLQILHACQGDQGATYRWQLALSGTDRWLRDFGFDLPARHKFARDARDGYQKEMRAQGKATQGWLADRFRKERKSIEPLIQPNHRSVIPALAAGLASLDHRSQVSVPTMNEMRRIHARGGLTRSLERVAHSVIHMHCNRVLRSAQRTQEFVIYEFLARLYDSELARLRTRVSDGSDC